MPARSSRLCRGSRRASTTAQSPFPPSDTPRWTNTTIDCIVEDEDVSDIGGPARGKEATGDPEPHGGYRRPIGHHGACPHPGGTYHADDRSDGSDPNGASC